jgi:hypothetical protein
MRGLAILFCVCLSVLTHSVAASEPQYVSMVQLLATPDRFHGKFIHVEGFLRLEFEGDALYLHKEDYRHQLTKNAIWVDNIGIKGAAELNMHYVLIEGVFNAKDQGHLGLFSGQIEKISRAERSE